MPRVAGQRLDPSILQLNVSPGLTASYPRPRPVGRVTVLVGVGLALAAFTAFGIAPRSDTDPTAETVVEALRVDGTVVFNSAKVVQSERIRRGETLVSLLDRLGAADAGFLRFVTSDTTARRLLQLRSGRSITAQIASDGRIESLQYRHGDLHGQDTAQGGRLTIRREEGKLVAIDEPLPLERQVQVASVVIQSSLFSATDAAGIPERVAANVADILEADIDLRRELRRGARLSVVYETIREADSIGRSEPGRVLAVRLINGGDRHEAVLFERGGEAPPEYYRFDGRSMRNAFLLNPIEFSRISSGFSGSRTHPLHGDARAHRGVDFAAPSGTPVRAAGVGVVEFAGRQRGYGNVVVLKHRNGINTLYAHLRGFAGTLSAGDKVEQGDVIGYVGSTGWATGPHLHYEYIVNGEQVDPLTAVQPEADPLDGAERELFAKAAGALVARLEWVEQPALMAAASFE